jgi:hypothetical protein
VWQCRGGLLTSATSHHHDPRRRSPVGDGHISDAAVIACAEQSEGTIATLNRRDFEVVAPETSMTLVP